MVLCYDWLNNNYSNGCDFLRKHMLKLGFLITLLLVLASCGNVEGKNNKKDSLDNDELINFAIEDFISNENKGCLHSTCPKDDIRVATDIERWNGK